MVLKNNKKIIISVLFFAVAAAFSFGLEVPNLQGRINDYADVIDPADEAELTANLARLDEQTGIQIAVLTVPSLEGDSIESFSLNVAEKWKLGQEGEDNGALFVLALEEHDVRIEVGYGLEGLLTDATSGLILRNVVIPEFKNGDYSEGILQGVTNMVGIALGDEELIDKDVLDGDDNDMGIVLIVMIVWVLFIVIVITSKGGLWKWVAISNATGSHHHSTPSSSFSSFSGGSSFGGFSGGGGSFGGGGASAHW